MALWNFPTCQTSTELSFLNSRAHAFKASSVSFWPVICYSCHSKQLLFSSKPPSFRLNLITRWVGGWEVEHGNISLSRSYYKMGIFMPCVGKSLQISNVMSAKVQELLEHLPGLTNLGRGPPERRVVPWPRWWFTFKNNNPTMSSNNSRLCTQI